MGFKVYTPTSNAEETEAEQFYEDLQDLLELTPKKDVLFIIGDWDCKSRKSRNTWSNRQIWPWNVEWSRTNRVLPRKCAGHSKQPLPNTREDSTHGHHQMVNTEIRLIIIFFAAKDGEALYSQQTQDLFLHLFFICGSDHELLIVKLRLKLKKVGKTTRQFRFELNQIPYDYTVEVRNRFRRFRQSAWRTMDRSS